MNVLTRWSARLSVISLGLLVFFVVYDASMRYLFSRGSTAIQELQWHLFDIVILFSIAYAFAKGAHVRVDILYERFPAKVRASIDWIASVFFVVPFSVFIVYTGFDFVWMSFTQHEASSDPGGLPYRWIVKSFMLIAFILLLVETVSTLWDNMKKLRK